MKRRTFVRLTGGSVALGGLSGCLGEPPSLGAGGLTIAIVSGTDGFGGGGFSDLALQGLEQAVQDFGGTVEQVEGDNGQFVTLQSQVAESETEYDLVVCVSADQTDALAQNADAYPDQRWMLVDGGVFRDDGSHFENVAGYVWANDEMSFQAGVAAGTMTKRAFSYDGNGTDPDGEIVGFVRGVDTPLVDVFERAYTAGVEYVDDGVEVMVDAGALGDPGASGTAATSLYEGGADVLYHAPSVVGPGVFEAARNSGRFAIGVDVDQSAAMPEYSDVVLGSAVEYVNVGTYEAAEAVSDNDWESVGGQRNVLGLASDAVAFVPGVDVGSELPPVVDENLQAAKEGVVNGDVDVPCGATEC